MSSALRGIITQLGAVMGVTMISCGLWIWGLAEAWAVGAERVGVATWSNRCFAASLIAAGQVVLAVTVLPGFFARPGRRFGVFEQVVVVVASLAAVLAAVAGSAWAAAAGW